MIGAVLGNSPLNIGVASAVELAAAGHEVRVALGREGLAPHFYDRIAI